MRFLQSPFLTNTLLMTTQISFAFQFYFFGLFRAHESRELAERQKLEADRVDFAAHVTSASRAAEVQREYMLYDHTHHRRRSLLLRLHTVHDLTLLTLMIFTFSLRCDP